MWRHCFAVSNIDLKDDLYAFALSGTDLPLCLRAAATMIKESGKHLRPTRALHLGQQSPSINRTTFRLLLGPDDPNVKQERGRRRKLAVEISVGSVRARGRV